MRSLPAVPRPELGLLAVILLAAAANLVSGQAHSGVIVGVVTSLPSRQPLVGASVEIAGANRGTRTDSSGNFRVADLPAGNVTVRVRAIGYEAITAIASIADDSTVRLDFAFREVVELAPVTVESPTLGARDARLRGFYERRAAGFGGKFVAREDIEKRDPGDSRDLLRAMPGVRVVGNRIQMASGMSSPNCRVQYFLDGIHILAPAADFLVSFRPRDLEGIEVYRGPAETPLAFSRGGAECGVIAIWTRTPGGRK